MFLSLLSLSHFSFLFVCFLMFIVRGELQLFADHLEISQKEDSFPDIPFSSIDKLFFLTQANDSSWIVLSLKQLFRWHKSDYFHVILQYKKDEYIGLQTHRRQMTPADRGIFNKATKNAWNPKTKTYEIAPKKFAVLLSRLTGVNLFKSDPAIFQSTGEEFVNLLCFPS